MGAFRFACLSACVVCMCSLHVCVCVCVYLSVCEYANATVRQVSVAISDPTNFTHLASGMAALAAAHRFHDQPVQQGE
jgi:hypothetical protein